MTITTLLRAPKLEDVDYWFPLIFETAVVDTLLWDGPTSREESRARWTQTVEETAQGTRHLFVVTHPDGGEPIGCADVRPDAHYFRGDCGLWLGERHQGRGLGTRAVAELVRYAFERLEMTKLEAHVFVGNWASRRIFEKNGFDLEGTIRAACRKRGRPVDEWYLGIVRR